MYRWRQVQPRKPEGITLVKVFFECHWINRTNTESKLNSWEYKMFHRSWPDHSVAFSLGNCVDGCADSNGLACGQILVSTFWSRSTCLFARRLNRPGYHRMPPEWERPRPDPNTGCSCRPNRIRWVSMLNIWN